MLAKREGSWLWEVRSLVDERLGRFFEQLGTQDRRHLIAGDLQIIGLAP